MDKCSSIESPGLMARCVVALRRVSSGRFGYVTGISVRHNSELSQMSPIRQ